LNFAKFGNKVPKTLEQMR